MKDFINLPKDARLYLLSTLLHSMYFTWPAWFGFASEVLSATQVGVYFSVMFVVQLIMEVPTGVLADLYGRKNSALLGKMLSVPVPIIMYTMHSLNGYMLCAGLLGLGRAFASGSLDSFIYDKKEVSKRQFKTILNLRVIFFQTGLITGLFFGGFAYSYKAGLPYYLEAIVATLSLLCVIAMSQDEKRSEHTAAVRRSTHYVAGFKELATTSALKLLVVISLVLGVIFPICIEFINEASLIEYGLDPSGRGVLMSAVKIINLFIFQLVFFRFIKKDQHKILFLSLAAFAVFLAFSLGIYWLFLVFFVVFNWVAGLRKNFIDPMIHDRIGSQYRATCMSSLALLTGLVGIVANIGSGYLIDSFGSSRSAYIVFAVVCLGVVLPAAVSLRKQLD